MKAKGPHGNSQLIAMLCRKGLSSPVTPANDAGLHSHTGAITGAKKM